MLCVSLGVQAQSSFFNRSEKSSHAGLKQKKESVIKPTTQKVSSGLIKTMEAQVAKSPALRRAAKSVEQMDVVLLDSVISDDRCEYYEYNDYGWLTSVKIYEREDGAMQLDTEDSYFLKYEFDEQGRCTYYGEFEYNADGTEGQEIQRVIVTWTSSRARTEKYYAIPREWDKLELTAEVSYDQYGNYCLMIFYDWDEEKKEMILEEYLEMKFTGNVMEYYYTEEGYLDGMDLDEVLAERYCYYYVEYDMSWNYEDEVYCELYGFKIDTTTDGLTTTKVRYEVDLNEEYGDEIDFDQLDSYWEFEEEEVITLTPSRNRYASIYFYDKVYESDDNVNYPEDRPVEEEMVEKPVATRTTSEKELVLSYEFEWDEYERLVKYTEFDEGDERVYTCTYHDDEYRVITLADLEQAWYLYWVDDADDFFNLMRGGFYGKVYKEHIEAEDSYGEAISYEYDSNGKVLHYKESEVYYSDVEMGVDQNGDGVMSTEREVYSSEYWYTYDAKGNKTMSIEYDDSREEGRAYKKREYINEPSGNQYLLGKRDYRGASKEGPWKFVYESIDIYAKDPATNPHIESVGGWYREYEYDYDYDYGTWYGHKWEIVNGSYVSYSIDPETGEFSTTGYAAERRSEDLQEGYYDIYFTEDGWEYQGYKNVGYVWDEQSETEVLKITDGEMKITREGSTNGTYHAEDPADNYEFPVGIYFMGVESESVGEIHWEAIYIVWDSELDGWRVEWGMEEAVIYSHYTNGKGQIVDEMKTYTFNPDTERMELKNTTNGSIYSFDELNRLSSIENSAFTTHYIYRNDECNYLLESYMTDNATGDKYNVCKYYYNDAQYTFPYTDIEEVKASKAWTVSGTTVMADGQIVLYNMNGQVAAQGWGIATAPQSGLYIVSFDGTRTKVWLE